MVVFIVCFVAAVVSLTVSTAAAGPIHQGSQVFANPDDLSDCPLAPPAFSADLTWTVYYTSDPMNPAAALLDPANADTFTIVLEVGNHALLNLPVECGDGPHTGDPNPGDLAKLNVGTFNLGYGDFTFPAIGDYGTIDDGNPSTPAPSGYNATTTSMEFLFDSPNIAAGETTQKLFFTIPSIEPGEVASCFLQTSSASTDDEPVVFLPLQTVPVEGMSWGALKATYK